MKCRTLLCAAAAIVSLSTNAAAYDWTGFYIGGHAGAGWGPSTQQLTTRPGASALNIIDPIAFNGVSRLGGVGGIHAGYNWQFTPFWVVGLEGDFSLTSLNRTEWSNDLTRSGIPLPPGNNMRMTTDVNWMASTRGRIGYAWDRILLYATGGFAWADIDYDARFSFQVDPYNATGSSSRIRSGWVWGGGLQYAVASNWVLRAEYLHYRFEDGPSIEGVVLPQLPPSPSFVFSWGETIVQVLQIGLSYKFVGGL
jgi:outer membrane immunogenic protein